MSCLLAGRDWEFCQLLHRSWRSKLRPPTTWTNGNRPDVRRNWDHFNHYQMGDCTSDQSRLSTGTCSRRDWLSYRQTKTADLGRPFKVS